MPFSATWDTTNHRAERNSPLQNTFLWLSILLRNVSVAFPLINITPQKAVENLFITLLITSFRTEDKKAGFLFNGERLTSQQFFNTLL